MYQASLDEKEWAKSQLRFISEFHDWFTDSAKNLYEKKKQKNIAALKKHHKLK